LCVRRYQKNSCASPDAVNKLILAASLAGIVISAQPSKAKPQAQSPQPAARALDVDGPVPIGFAPPPPPPPPTADGRPAAALPPGAIRVEGSEQQAKLVTQPKPLYPPQARRAGISGAVHLGVLIAKDGTVQNIGVVNGHPLLAPAAIDAVRKWVYQQTLLNGEPVEVATSVTVNFQLAEQ
jgi:TonB family protein